MNAIPDNVTGWWLSEKLDGARIFWTGTAFLSRSGRRFAPPPHWYAGMPDCRLDGELYAGRGGFDFLVSQIQRKGGDWQGITFQIFDLAELRRPIESRLATLARLSLPGHCQLVPHRVCGGAEDLERAEVDVVSNGGEGLILREAGSFYRPNNFLKVKRLFPDLNRNQLD